jgi:hypothetical protein
VRHHSDLTLWHMADPGDVLQLDNPANLYGLLQSTGTQKLFFEHATVANQPGQAPLNCKQPPKIADIGSLLGSSGLLPTIASLLDFPSFKGFSPSGDGLATKVVDDTAYYLALGACAVIATGSACSF